MTFVPGGREVAREHLVRVRHRRRAPGLGAKPRKILFVLGQFPAQQLYRHRSAKDHVGRAPHLTHGPAADSPIQPVPVPSSNSGPIVTTTPATHTIVPYL
jgi:hypothetical protein